MGEFIETLNSKENKDLELEEEKNKEIEIILMQEKNEELISLEYQENVEIITRNYETLKNLPSINGVKLIKEKTFNDLGALGLTNIEIEKMINNIIL